MNKKYKIVFYVGDTEQGLWRLNETLLVAFWKTEYYAYNVELSKYGLVYMGNSTDNVSVYEVIDEELFSLFLLEYADKLTITEYHE